MSKTEETYEDWTEEQFLNLLSDKEQAFCRAYVISFNQAKAARKAGYSKDSAKEQGYRMSTKAHIKAFVSYLMEFIITDDEISAKRTLREYAKVAYFDPRDLYDEDGNLIPPNELPDDVAAAIIGIDVEVIGRFGDRPEKGQPDDRKVITSVKYKLANRHAYLQDLGKYKKLFADRKIIEGDADNPLALKHGMTDEVKELLGEIYEPPGSE